MKIRITIGEPSEPLVRDIAHHLEIARELCMVVAVFTSGGKVEVTDDLPDGLEPRLVDIDVGSLHLDVIVNAVLTSPDVMTFAIHQFIERMKRRFTEGKERKILIEVDGRVIEATIAGPMPDRIALRVAPVEE